jgi:hypothetical protein
MRGAGFARCTPVAVIVLASKTTASWEEQLGDPAIGVQAVVEEHDQRAR